jgi:outer membrane protein assembly factor BamB
MVLAGGSDGLSAFDADTGEQLWRRKLSINSTPAVVDGVLYVGGSGRVGGPYRVAALSAATGATLWTFHTAWLIRSSPAVVDGVVYVSSEDGRMYALDAATGHMVWGTQLEELFSVMSTPAVAAGIVYLQAGSNVVALDAGTGALVWQSDCHGEINSRIAVVDGVVYGTGFLGGSLSYMCAWDAATGQPIWDVQIETGGVSDFVSDFVTDGRTIYGVASQTVFALDAGTGAEIWQQDGGAGFSYLSLANGVLYVGENGAIFYHHRGLVNAFDPSTGALLWSDKLDALREVAIPVIADGRLYLVTQDESVIAFELP